MSGSTGDDPVAMSTWSPVSRRTAPLGAVTTAECASTSLARPVTTWIGFGPSPSVSSRMLA